jgi:hypothetical protein
MVDAEEKVEASKSTLLSGNLLVIIWVVLGTVGCYLINPIVGWVFLAFSALSIYIIIRRLLCNSCYYCKSCTKGMAKLSIMSLGANRIPGLSKGSVLGMAIYVYIILLVIPSCLLVSSLMQQFSILQALSLAGILVISAYSIVARVKKGNKLVTH